MSYIRTVQTELKSGATQTHYYLKVAKSGVTVKGPTAPR
jgi:hypothetical protein